MVPRLFAMETENDCEKRSASSGSYSPKQKRRKTAKASFVQVCGGTRRQWDLLLASPAFRWAHRYLVFRPPRYPYTWMLLVSFIFWKIPPIGACYYYCC